MFFKVDFCWQTYPRFFFQVMRRRSRITCSCICRATCQSAGCLFDAWPGQKTKGVFMILHATPAKKRSWTMKMVQLEQESYNFWSRYVFKDSIDHKNKHVVWNLNPGGSFKYFYFHPYLGKIPILTNTFQMGWNHQPLILTAHPLGLKMGAPEKCRWMSRMRGALLNITPQGA